MVLACAHTLLRVVVKQIFRRLYFLLVLQRALSNKDFCLVNYYVPGQEYRAHEDSCQLTAVTLLGFGEFTGGGFAFPDQGVEIEFKQSRTIIFPSCVNHASMPLEGGQDACRVSIAQFIDSINRK